MNTFDLNILPLVRRAGQDRSSLPGLYVVKPPRRSARGRSVDQLILYLAMSTGIVWNSEQQTQLLAQTAQVYYETAGSVTSASRAATEYLNQYLLERNLRAEGSKNQGTGWFTLVAMRAERLYLTQAGPMRSFLITSQQTQELSDISISGPGLGLARPPKMRYAQVEMSSDEYLLLTPVMPTLWESSGLQGVYGQGLEGMRRRLLGHAGADVTAVLIQPQAGGGNMRLLWPKTALSESASLSTTIDVGKTPVSSETEEPVVETAGEKPTSTDEEEPVAESVIDTSVVSSGEGEQADMELGPSIENDEGDTSRDDLLQEEDSSVGEVASVSLASTLESLEPPDVADSIVSDIQSAEDSVKLPIDASPAPVTLSDDVFESTSSPSSSVSMRRLNDQPAARSTKPRRSPGRFSQISARFGSVVKTFLAALWRAIRVTIGTLGRLFRRLLPDESLFSLPSSTMIFLAVAVPVLIAVIGGMIFINRGLSAQAQAYYQESVQLAQQARAQGDPVLQRVAWEETLTKVEQAENFDRGNDDIQALKLESVTALDQLNHVKRLTYRSVLTEPLNQSLNIISMVATQDELYMLTDAQGSVSRALQTSIGYKTDVTFNCGPGMYGTRAVGRLVDILSLPPGSEFNATILAMDSNANLLYCIPHERPKAISMATPTIAGWGNTAHFALDIDNHNLYVLDPVKQNVWIYEKLNVSTQPIAFFDQTIDQIPNLEDVVDMAVNRATIYLLHADGRTTLCEFGRLEGNLSRCQDPIDYQDSRPGRQSGPTIDGALFSALQYTQPPDPSIFMFDPEMQSIYQFGLLQLNFYYQYRPKIDVENPLPDEPATAFAISPARVAFLAIGDLVYQANIIP